MTRSEGGGGFAGLGLDLTAFRGDSRGRTRRSALGEARVAALDSLLQPLGLLVRRRRLSISSRPRSCHVGAEARWREISLDRGTASSSPPGSRASRVGRRRATPTAGTGRGRPPAPVDALRHRCLRRCRRTSQRGFGAALADSSSRPRPRRWAGRTSRVGPGGRRGFDCSGLIQYAYAKHGSPCRGQRRPGEAGQEVKRKTRTRSRRAIC